MTFVIISISNSYYTMYEILEYYNLEVFTMYEILEYYNLEVFCWFIKSIYSSIVYNINTTSNLIKSNN
jgi:hypothetical protein